MRRQCLQCPNFDGFLNISPRKIDCRIISYWRLLAAANLQLPLALISDTQPNRVTRSITLSRSEERSSEQRWINIVNQIYPHFGSSLLNGRSQVCLICAWSHFEGLIEFYFLKPLWELPDVHGILTLRCNAICGRILWVGAAWLGLGIRAHASPGTKQRAINATHG